MAICPNRPWIVLSILFILLAITFDTASVDAKPRTEEADIIPGRYIVILKENDSPAQVAARNGAKPLVTYGFAFKGFAGHFSDQIVRRLERDPSVAAIYPDTISRQDEADIGAVRDLSLAGPQQSGQVIPTGINRVDADQNPTAKIDGVDDPMDVDIAIIDGGIQPDHPDLEVVGGVAFLGTNCSGGSFADENGHGTHVAGTVAAIDNNIGVVGIAPGARLWAVRVLGADGTGATSCVLKGVDWVMANASTIEVANMSIESRLESTMCTAMANSAAAGVVYAVSAGNDLTDASSQRPANCPDVLAVSAIADSDGAPGGLNSKIFQFPGKCTMFGDDVFTCFSNFGPLVDIAAPGAEILSTSIGSSYAVRSGTSMASPHVAGAAALDIVTHGKPTTAQAAAAVRSRVVGASSPQSDTFGFLRDPECFREPLLYLGSLAIPADDVAVSCLRAPEYLKASPAAAQGDLVPVSIGVLNRGSNSKTITVSLTASGGVVGPGQTVTLAGRDYTGVTINWDTATASVGPHTLTATVTTDVDSDTANNTNVFNSFQVRELRTLVVTSAADPGTNGCDATECTLREAIDAANAGDTRSVIRFNIAPGGPQTITPLTVFPDIITPVTIDGTTQPGYAGSPIIELNGGSLSGFFNDGLRLLGGGSVVRALVINRFSNDGIELSRNGRNAIEGNFIGTDVTGTVAMVNRLRGINIEFTSDNVIGGPSTAARNVISGSVSLTGAVASGNQILGNLMGTTASGSSPLGGGGVSITDAPGTRIGGAAVGERNIISGGITIAWTHSTGNEVLGNYIGTDITGSIPIPAAAPGVFVFEASNNIVGGVGAGTGNIIAYHDSPTVLPAMGVLVSGETATGNSIRGNSIYSNEALGINLGSTEDLVTPNDPGDGDTGPNKLQNFPVLASAVSNGTITTVAGSLNSTANTTFNVDLYRNVACDPTGYGEGETFIATTTVTTNESGAASFTVGGLTSVLLGEFVTATATDPEGNTSEFSACLAVVPQTVRASTSTAGVEANDDNFVTFGPSVSASGRFIAFESLASNLVPGDGAFTDVFVRDRDADADGVFDEPGSVATALMSVSSSGQPGYFDSLSATIDPTGRYVAFVSIATNLVSDDTNWVFDVFLHDRDTDSDGLYDEPGAIATSRVSLGAGGTEGEYESFHPSVSDGGRYVAFHSFATNLVSGDTNICNGPRLDPYAQIISSNCSDIFVRDTQTNTTVRVSVATSGAQANGDSISPRISGDGRFVSFHSQATNLVAGDTNNAPDVFVHDRDADADGVFDEPGAISTGRVSLASSGTEGNGTSDDAIISSNGRFVAFHSSASNLVSGDTNSVGDVFLRDRDVDSDGIFDEVGGVTTTRISVARSGAQGDVDSGKPSMSADGRFITFESAASNLSGIDTNGDSLCDALCDTNNAEDVFVHDRGNGLTQRISLAYTGAQAAAGGFASALDSSGKSIAFVSASSLVPEDANGKLDVFVRTFEPDEDNDGVFDIDELACGSDRTNPFRRPERLDGPFAGVDDDGDTFVDEALPAWAGNYDCDGDGYVGATELFVGMANGDRDPCGTDGWPAEFVSGTPGSFSYNKINIQDLTSYLAPVRRLDTSPGDPGYAVRWDIVPGNSGLAKEINIADMSSMISLAPPMLDGVTAFNGPSCPWVP